MSRRSIGVPYDASMPAPPAAAPDVAAASPPSPPSPPRVGARFVLATYALWLRELVRFVRQPTRIVGALGTPIVFWLVIGAGLDRAFVVPGAGGGEGLGVGYMAYFFPGTVLLILLFTAIFSTISTIEDRREGFLQGVLASPAPRSAVVLGKVLGGATLATLQAALFIAAWPLLGGWASWEAAALTGLVVAVVAVMLTALGLVLAWPMESTAGFHAVMNLVLLPMWLLSGAVFPLATAPLPLRVLMLINPLTYGHALLSHLMQGHASPAAGPTPALASAVVIATAAILLAVTTWQARRT